MGPEMAFCQKKRQGQSGVFSRSSHEGRGLRNTLFTKLEPILDIQIFLEKSYRSSLIYYSLYSIFIFISINRLI